MLAVLLMKGRSYIDLRADMHTETAVKVKRLNAIRLHLSNGGGVLARSAIRSTHKDGVQVCPGLYISWGVPEALLRHHRQLYGHSHVSPGRER